MRKEKLETRVALKLKGPATLQSALSNTFELRNTQGARTLLIGKSSSVQGSCDRLASERVKTPLPQSPEPSKYFRKLFRNTLDLKMTTGEMGYQRFGGCAQGVFGGELNLVETDVDDREEC